MRRARRLADTLRRSAHAGVALLRSTAVRPGAPLKLNFCLTYWCQYRCKTCNIWQRKPVDELTTDEVITFIKRNPHISWVDLTGGEIFLRPDIDDIFDAVLTSWRRLALLHFPTNGFLTDRIVASAEKLAGRGPGQTVITVSVDGNEELNDEIRGIKGGFARQVDTFNALRRIRGITTVFGVTLSKHNLGRFPQTFDALARACPGLTIDDVHMNVAQVSAHYYDNDRSDIEADAENLRGEVSEYRALRGRPRSAQQLLENAYLGYLDKFLKTGVTPMPCHALRASCFVDPWGVVYPCISYSRPIGRLRDTGMRLDPMWNAPDTIQIQREIWKGQCPQCWTACEAYQTILGNVLAGRCGSRSAAVSPLVQTTTPASERLR